MSEAHRRLLEQLDRIPPDRDIRYTISEGIIKMSPEEVLAIASDLKAALYAKRNP